MDRDQLGSLLEDESEKFWLLETWTASSPPAAALSAELQRTSSSLSSSPHLIRVARSGSVIHSSTPRGDVAIIASLLTDHAAVRLRHLPAVRPRLSAERNPHSRISTDTRTRPNALALSKQTLPISASGDWIGTACVRASGAVRRYPHARAISV